MPRLPGLNFARNLFQHRTLLYQLIRRDFEQRFVGSAAGWVWGLIHPLVLLVSWVFVFQVCLGIRMPPEEVTDNYPVYLFCGFLPWLLFQDTVMRSAISLLEHSNLITKTVFPSEFFTVSIFFSSLVSHVLALALLMAVLGFWLDGISAMVWLLPPYMLLLGMFAIGLGWLFASLQVYLRDTAQLLSVFLTFWFWMTPIFISEQQIPENVRFLVQINPLAYVVRAYRERLLSYQPPSLNEFAILAAYAITAFVAGGLFFRHLKRGFADVL
jgi:ABC-type polysaccharide/polyol phosphate export permease